MSRRVHGSSSPLPTPPPDVGEGLGEGAALLRSPLLAPLPRPSTAGRRRRVVWRGMAFLLLGGTLLLAVLIVVWRLATRESVTGQLLYGLHDTLYLPIKGYAYTALLPTSLIWWAFGLLLLALLLVSWLGDRSFVRRPHASLTRWLIGMPLAAGWLVPCAQWLHRSGLPGDLLRQVAAHEREAAVRHLLMTPGQGAGATRRAIRLTNLAIQLQLLPPIGPVVSVRVALFWVQGLLVARLQRHDELTGLLLEQLPLVTVCLRAAGTTRPDSTASSNAPDAPAPEATGFALAALVRDLEWLAEIERRLLREAQSADSRGGSRRDRRRALAEAVPRTPLRALAVSVDARREILERARGMVEMRRFTARDSIRGGDGGQLAGRLPDLPPDALPLTGQLALDLALLVADLGQAAGLAEASLEATEALALSLDLHAARRLEHQPVGGPPPTPSPLEAVLLGLVTGLPRPEQYAVCSRLADADPYGRMAVWTARATADGPLQPADLAPVQARKAALQLAGGPEA
jgi:hypothetical protein